MITCIKCLENKFESEFKPNSKKCLSYYKIYQDDKC